VHCVPLLADRVTAAGVDAPVVRGLANLIEGHVAPERWAASLTAPRPNAVKREKVKVA
jgi:glycerol-3-phosphate dehydrogenase (NAD(P)+)